MIQPKLNGREGRAQWIMNYGKFEVKIQFRTPNLNLDLNLTTCMRSEHVNFWGKNLHDDSIRFGVATSTDQKKLWMVYYFISSWQVQMISMCSSQPRIFRAHSARSHLVMYTKRILSFIFSWAAVKIQKYDTSNPNFSKPLPLFAITTDDRKHCCFRYVSKDFLPASKVFFAKF